jgi:hypothetical protein
MQEVHAPIPLMSGFLPPPCFVGKVSGRVSRPEEAKALDALELPNGDIVGVSGTFLQLEKL